MSSMRNAVQRRNHRERAQPVERQKWGLLEKAKDYKLRAADHKVKKRKIKALQEKARDRNADEFYFGMMSSQSQGGVKVAKRGTENGGGGGGTLGGEVVKLMKTQDAGYLRTVLQQTKKEKVRLEEEIMAGDVGVNVAPSQLGSSRIVFGENVEFTHPSSLRIQPLQDDSDQDDVHSADAVTTAGTNDQSTREAQRKQHRQEVKRRKLQTLQDRERDLSIALREVDHQRAKMNGTVGGTNKKGVKFKVRDRKK